MVTFHPRQNVHHKYQVGCDEMVEVTMALRVSGDMASSGHLVGIHGTVPTGLARNEEIATCSGMEISQRASS